MKKIMINKTKIQFKSEEIKLTNHWSDSSKEKEKGYKSMKLEMKQETLQYTMQEYKGS